MVESVDSAEVHVMDSVESPNNSEAGKAFLTLSKYVVAKTLKALGFTFEKTGHLTEWTTRPIFKGIGKAVESSDAPNFVKKMVNGVPVLYEKAKKETRRKILGTMVIGGVLYAQYADIPQKVHDAVEDGIEWVGETCGSVKENVTNLFDVNNSDNSEFMYKPGEKIEQGDKEYEMGDFFGRKLGGLYAKYLGLDTKNPLPIPNTLSINFPKNINKLWEEKLNRKIYPVVKDAYQTLILDGYNLTESTPSSIDEFMSSADKSIEFVNDNLDWSEVAKLKGLNARELALTKKLVKTIDGKDLMSYCLTEIMPTADGKLNVAMLDFLLKNAGKEFIELIPALGDAYTSFGPYQFTSLALRDLPKEKYGASVVNQALPNDKKIPGSVMKLRGNDHHKAAYMFAINNIAGLVNSCNKSELVQLEKIENYDEIAHFMAAAHHAPGNGIKYARAWLYNNYLLEKGSPKADKKNKKFANYCRGRFVNYVKKSRNNLRALNNL
ncbi:hypothetical protein CSB37_03940 [bacterium DOLZORAL124_38_8]|nr:MAG: hypothetical protein CSB37_03940 [bacterium DOLZORAL124_38_8]